MVLEGTPPEGANHDESGAEESSPDTVRTPVVRLVAEDPQASSE